MAKNRTDYVQIPMRDFPLPLPDSNEEIPLCANIGTATLDPDAELVTIHWANNSGTWEKVWAFKKESLENVLNNTMEIVGTETDGASAVATRMNNSNALTDGKITEFANNDVAKGEVRHNGSQILARGVSGGFLRVAETEEEEITIAAAASTDSTLTIPEGALALVGARCTVDIPGTASFSVGTSANASAWGSGVTSTAGNDNQLVAATNGWVFISGSALAVRITPNTTPSAATGKVRIQVFYYQVQPPTT